MSSVLTVIESEVIVVETAAEQGPPGPPGTDGVVRISQESGNAAVNKPDGFYVPDTLASKVDSVAGKQGDVLLDKDDVGLGAVDNTSDADKPVSTAVADALERIELTAGEQGEPGPAGPSVELNVGSTHIQWRVEGATEWQDLIALASLTPSVESVVDAVVVQISNQLMPAGGTAGQVLAKTSDVDYDVGWVDSGPPPSPPQLGRLITCVTIDEIEGDQEISVFDLNSLDKVTILPVGTTDRYSEYFPYSTVTNRLVVSDDNHNGVFEFDLSTLELLKTTPSSNPMTMSPAAMLSKDGIRYFSPSGRNGEIQAVDLSTDPPTILWQTAAKFDVGSLDPEGNLYCIMGNTTSTEIRIYSQDGAYTLAPAPPGGIRQLFLISPDGTKAITRLGWGRLIVLDLADMSIIEEHFYYTSGGGSHRYIWSPDSTMITVKTSDLEVGAYRSDAVILTIGEPEPRVISIPVLTEGAENNYGVGGHCFNGDGSRYYIAGKTGVYELDTTSWELLRKIDAESAEVGWLPDA